MKSEFDKNVHAYMKLARQGRRLLARASKHLARAQRLVMELCVRRRGV